MATARTVLPWQQALNALHELLGARYCLQGEAMQPYLYESRGQFVQPPLAVLRPADTAQVSACARICHAARLPIIPQGGHSGRCGGAMPVTAGQGVILNLGRLNRIRALDADNYTLTVEAGCILAQVQQAATAAQRLFPLSLGSEGSCQIGGNLASNAGGLNTLRYGNARELCLGLEVVLADGRVWDGLRGLHKDNTGYDLRDLFIGSEGTLGIITAAVLRLFPRPHYSSSLLCSLRTLDDSIRLLSLARQISGGQVARFELLPQFGLQLVAQHSACRVPLALHQEWYVLLELEGFSQLPASEALLERALEAGYIVDAVHAQSLAQAQALWQLREQLVEVQKFAGVSLKHDIAVPVMRVAEFIQHASAAVHARLPGVRVYAFGHVGDGNIHYNLSQPPTLEAHQFRARQAELAECVQDIALQLGGSFSAEHGIGQLKTAAMLRYKSPLELALMRSLKQALDPQQILNPGKVLPPLPPDL